MTAIYLVIGLAAGLLSGLFGLGGGIIIVPALVLLARMPQASATGTSLGALLIPLGTFIGVASYYRNGNVDIRASGFIALGLAAGAFLGARLHFALAGVWVQRAFAVFLVAVAIRMWIAAK